MECLNLGVVIGVLDGEKVLGRQLAALAGQQATCSWEVVGVDNGPTGGTVALVEGFAAAFPYRSAGRGCSPPSQHPLRA